MTGNTAPKLLDLIDKYASAVADTALSGYAHVDGLGLRHLRDKDIEAEEMKAREALLAALAPPSGDAEKVITMLLECGYVDERNLAQARRIVAGLAQNKVDHQEGDQ